MRFFRPGSHGPLGTALVLAPVGCLAAALWLGCNPFDPNLGTAPFACAKTPPLCPDGYGCVSGMCIWHGEPRNDAGIKYDTGLYRPDFGTCPDADLEPNDTPATATVLLHQDVTLKNLAICPAGDVDYYSLLLKNGDMVTLDLLEAPGGGEVDLALVGSDGSTVLKSAMGPNADQHVTYTATTDGTYYVLASGSTTTVANAYSLQVQLASTY